VCDTHGYPYGYNRTLERLANDPTWQLLTYRTNIRIRIHIISLHCVRMSQSTVCHVTLRTRSVPEFAKHNDARLQRQKDTYYIDVYLLTDELVILLKWELTDVWMRIG
jgi:hypothetical protein